MKKNELDVIMPDIQFTVGVVKFDNFEMYKEEAEAIARFISEFELTDNNVNDAKAMLAGARRVVQGLDKKRIEIKKTILAPYEDFASQIDELKAIVNDADSKVRSAIKSLENKQRKEKQKQIRKIWDKRIVMYDLDGIPSLFDKWLTPQHLNKGMSMKKVEESMVEFLEKVQQDIEALNTFDNSAELIADYLDRFNLPEVFANAKARQAREAQARQIKEAIDEETVEPTAVFVIKGQKDIVAAEALLKANGIEFEKK